MKKIIILDKKEGETPLSALENFRKKHPEYQGVSLTYAGRLDPMARGLLIVLAEDKIKDKETYLALDKEYHFTVLFGLATDTHDILGKVIDSDKKKTSAIKTVQEMKELLEKELPFFTGELVQEYPMYSSKTVNGLPLFEYARTGRAVKIPARKIVVKKIILQKIRKVKPEILLPKIEKRISKVVGDFRQKEIIQKWRRVLGTKKAKGELFLVDFVINCSSGTYVRKIAHDLGERLKVGGLAFEIYRTRVGRYRI